MQPTERRKGLTSLAQGLFRTTIGSRERVGAILFAGGMVVLPVLWAVLLTGWGAQVPLGMALLVLWLTILWSVAAGGVVAYVLARRTQDEQSAPAPERTPAVFSEDLEETLQRVMVPYVQDVTRALAEAAASGGRVASERGRLWIERLHHVFRLVAEAESEEEVCENLVTAFSLLDEYTQVAILRGEDELGPLTLMAALGIPDAALREWRGKPWRPPLWGVVAPVMTKRKAYALNVSELQDEEFPWPIRGAYLEVLPLLGVRRLQGVVVLVRGVAPRQVDPVRQQVYDILCWLGGQALENLTLAREMQERVTELAVIHSLARSLMFAGSLAEMVRVLQAEITQLVGPADVAVILAEDLEQRQAHVVYPPDSPDYKAVMEALDWRVLRWVWQAVQPVFYTPGQVGDEIGDVMFETHGRVLVIPIEGREEPVGLLVLRARAAASMFEELQLMSVRTLIPAITVGLYAQQLALSGRREPQRRARRRL